MRLDTVKLELGKDWSGYEEAIRNALQHSNKLLTKINGYIIDTAGKQLRPVLCLLSAQASGEVSQMSYECAAVCEIIHTATLLHDDVADNGDIRRGVPTVKAAFSPAASVLTGDYWLARGVDLLINKCNTEILGYFTTVLHDLSVGEIIQMEKAEDLDTTMEDYYKIIECKTASLFMAAVKSGAISAGAKKEDIDSLAEYAYHLGVAFQMRDDIFDYSPKMDTGKLAGADIKERKITLPLLCAMANAPEKEAQMRHLIEGIENTVTKGEEITTSDKEIIGKITEFVNSNNGIADAQNILEGHIAKAIAAIAALPESNAKKRLVQLAEFTGSRNS
ncbi:MAG: polyprenyl synthetase family protein [Bacteroidales bacterium]|nr:polyprenyl synthetase family protein [Bacteroidales bacterium]